jgi:hypothetical protein
MRGPPFPKHSGGPVHWGRLTTVEAAKSPNYKTFLSNFGKFEVAGLETKEVSEQEFLSEQLAELQKEMRSLASSVSATRSIPATRNNIVGIDRLYKAINDGLSEGQLSKEDIIHDNTPKILGYLAGDHLDFFDHSIEFERAAMRAITKAARRARSM